jgi:hypothetical protein
MTKSIFFILFGFEYLCKTGVKLGHVEGTIYENTFLIYVAEVYSLNKSDSKYYRNSFKVQSGVSATLVHKKALSKKGLLILGREWFL